MSVSRVGRRWLALAASAPLGVPPERAVTAYPVVSAPRWLAVAASPEVCGVRMPVAASVSAHGYPWVAVAAFVAARVPGRAFSAAVPVAGDAVARDWSVVVPVQSSMGARSRQPRLGRACGRNKYENRSCNRAGAAWGFRLVGADPRRPN